MHMVAEVAVCALTPPNAVSLARLAEALAVYRRIGIWTRVPRTLPWPDNLVGHAAHRCR
jgi:hypothetical protein